MQLKPITAIIVLSLVVASLSVAGCTTSTTSDTNQAPSASATPSAATHDAFLEKYLATFKNVSYADKNIKAWELTWLNSTSARLEYTTLNQSGVADTHSITFIVFPTTQEATQYINDLHKTKYTYSTVASLFDSYSYKDVYENVTSHEPQVSKAYVRLEEGVGYPIFQLDNLIISY